MSGMTHPDSSDEWDEYESEKWVLPRSPNPLSVPDNTKSWWVFYTWRGEPNPSQRHLSIAITREITPPWRRGLGIMWRRKHRASALGVWIRGHAPRILSDSPSEKDWRKTAARASNLESGVERN